MDIQIDGSAKPLNDGDGAALSIANTTLAGAVPGARLRAYWTEAA
jgi:hypothetical protein